MVSTSSQEVRLFLACRFVISVQLRQLPDHVGENAALFLQLGPPSTLILQDKTLFKGQKFENVRVSLSRGRETLWKQRFSKTMTSRQSRDFSDRILLKHKWHKWLLRFCLPPVQWERKTLNAFSEWNLRFEIPLMKSEGALNSTLVPTRGWVAPRVVSFEAVF